MKTSLRIAVLTLLASVLTTGYPQQGGSLDGIVLQEDGRTAMANVRVSLQMRSGMEPNVLDATGGYQTRSDASGRFSLKDVTPGRYWLTAKQPGFLQAEFGSKRLGGRGTPIDVAPGRTLHDLKIRMTRGAVVAGRVLDNTGKPVTGARVRLVLPGFNANGQRVSVMVQEAYTNDLGEYRIFWVAPGSYLISAIPVVERGGPLSLKDQYEGLEEILLPVFYPNSPDIRHASTLRVDAGTEVRGIDVTIPLVPTVRIRGRVETQTGQPAANAILSLEPQNGADLMWNNDAKTNSKGEFDFRRIPAGVYTLYSNAYVGGGLPSSTRRELVVGDTDIPDLRIALRETPLIRGRMSYAEETPSSVNVIFFLLSQDESDERAIPLRVPNGSYEEVVLPRGTFRLVLPSRDGYYIGNARMGSRDVQLDGIDTSEVSGDPLEVTVALSTASVDGSVTDDQGKPAVGATVALVPNLNRHMRPDLFKDNQTDQAGHFKLSGVAPGDYKLFAWADLEPYAYFDPDLLQPFEARATPVHVDLNGTVRVNLKVLQ